MARITVEDCLTKETNRFGLVLLAAKRAKQILHGAKQVIEEERNNKAVVTALREIADGKVRFMNEAEMKEAEEKRLAERESAIVPDAAPLTNAAQLLAGGDSAGDEAEDEGESRNGSSPAVV